MGRTMFFLWYFLGDALPSFHGVCLAVHNFDGSRVSFTAVYLLFFWRFTGWPTAHLLRRGALPGFTGFFSVPGFVFYRWLFFFCPPVARKQLKRRRITTHIGPVAAARNPNENITTHVIDFCNVSLPSFYFILPSSHRNASRRYWNVKRSIDFLVSSEIGRSGKMLVHCRWLNISTWVEP